jgi:glutamyl-tRNA synthetase
MSQEHAGKTLLEAGQDPSKHREYISRVLNSDAKNYTTADEFVKSHTYFFVQDVDSERPKGVGKKDFNPYRYELYRHISRAQHDWHHDNLAAATNEAIDAIIDEATDKIKKKDIWKILRASLTGGQDGPSLIHTMEILGPDVVLKRLNEEHISY